MADLPLKWQSLYIMWSFGVKSDFPDSEEVVFSLLFWNGLGRRSVKNTKQAVNKQRNRPPPSSRDFLGDDPQGGCWFSFFCFYCVTVQDFCVTCSVALLWQLPGGDRGRVPFPLLSCISHFTSLRPHVPKRPLSNFTCPSENEKPRRNVSGEKFKKKKKSQYLVKICGAVVTKSWPCVSWQVSKKETTHQRALGVQLDIHEWTKRDPFI